MNVRYEKAVTARASYLVYLDDKPAAVVSQTRGGQWVASTIARPHLSVPACGSRHEATMALIGKLAEAGAV